MLETNQSQNIQINLDNEILIIRQEQVAEFLNIVWRKHLLPELILLFHRMFVVPSDLISQTKAAKLKGCSVKALQYHIRRGNLPVYTSNSLISLKQVKELQLRKDAGRKRPPYKFKSKREPVIETGLPIFLDH